MYFHGYRWISIQIHEILSTADGNLWISMAINELKWTTMYYNVFPWKSMNFNHRKLMKFNENPLRSKPISWKCLSNSKNTNMKRILRTKKHSHVEWNVKCHAKRAQSAILYLSFSERKTRQRCKQEQQRLGKCWRCRAHALDCRQTAQNEAGHTLIANAEAKRASPVQHRISDSHRAAQNKECMSLNKYCVGCVRPRPLQFTQSKHTDILGWFEIASCLMEIVCGFGCVCVCRNYTYMYLYI